MRLDTIRPALLAVVVASSGLPAALVGWADAPAIAVAGPRRANIDCDLLPSAVIGSADVSWAPYIPPPALYGAGVYGRGRYGSGVQNAAMVCQRLSIRREVTWTLVCSCYDQTDRGLAMRVLETVRDALEFDSTIDPLLAVDVSIVGAGDVQKEPFDVDAREYSRASLDVTLWVVTTTDDIPNAIPWIESVELTAI